MVNNKLDTTEPSKLQLESGFDLDLPKGQLTEVPMYFKVFTTYLSGWRTRNYIGMVYNLMGKCYVVKWNKQIRAD